jgi:hypothetical protein
VTRPEEALDAARKAAAEQRSRGAYADDLRGFAIEPTDATTVDKLLEWALIEPDAELVRSTRRWGRPITAVKRALVWALRQHNGQVYGQQTRFNHHMVLYARRLEDRVAELEQRLARIEAEREGGEPEPGRGERG